MIWKPVRYHKKWQIVASMFKDPTRYHRAKVIQLWILKIKKYPEEVVSKVGIQSEFTKELYDGLLIDMTLRIPKLMFKWDLFLWIGFNSKPNMNIFNPFKIRFRKAKLTKVPIQTKSVEELVKDYESIPVELPEEDKPKKKLAKKPVKKPTKKRSRSKKK